jgi:hypothetical protein
MLHAVKTQHGLQRMVAICPPWDKTGSMTAVIFCHGRICSMRERKNLFSGLNGAY